MQAQENASVQAKVSGNIRAFGLAFVLIETSKEMRQFVFRNEDPVG